MIFPHDRHGEHYDYKVGAVWRNADLVAPYDFAVLKTADERRQEEDAERQQALIYYRVDSTARATAMERLADAPFDEIVLLNTIPSPEKKLPNMKYLSVAPLFAEVIYRVHNNEPISKLFVR